MNRSRAADDYDFIRSRLEQIKKEKAQEDGPVTTAENTPKEYPNTDIDYGCNGIEVEVRPWNPFTGSYYMQSYYAGEFTEN